METLEVEPANPLLVGLAARYPDLVGVTDTGVAEQMTGITLSAEDLAALQEIPVETIEAHRDALEDHFKDVLSYGI